MSVPFQLQVAIERWPLAAPFSISRGSKTESRSVTVGVDDGVVRGRGECVPYARYGESPETVLAAIETLRPHLAKGIDRAQLQTLLPAGAARNALDCALWDYEAKKTGKRAVELAELKTLAPVTTAYTISLDQPLQMAEAAAKVAHWPLLKIKLGKDGVAERLKAVRDAAPLSSLIIDANEAWDETTIEENLNHCREADVQLVEQPLPEGLDTVLATIDHKVAICADESVHGLASLKNISAKYDAVNIKLDKSGGLTEALMMVKEVQNLGLRLMVGCMVASSLAVAPALLYAGEAAFVDLDGPLWLKRDRPFGLRFLESTLFPPDKELWG